jgi:hypothetical protein
MVALPRSGVTPTCQLDHTHMIRETLAEHPFRLGANEIACNRDLTRTPFSREQQWLDGGGQMSAVLGWELSVGPASLFLDATELSDGTRLLVGGLVPRLQVSR